MLVRPDGRLEPSSQCNPPLFLSRFHVDWFIDLLMDAVPSGLLVTTPVLLYVDECLCVVGSSSTQKTYRTLPFRTVELSSADGSSCEGEISPHMSSFIQHV